ncbi:hypothetical protein [Phytoactinopolyspora endophytica]|uniref:hypothetical protein n=1 Tax=Phytoactinopolyspora endophytica TaxID=1642495 RepID=UPI00197BFCF8|nr:hypothetical protein [Phytoactinopolyspora endophytica]
MRAHSRRGVRRAVLATLAAATALAACASGADDPSAPVDNTSEAGQSNGSAGRLLEETSADGHQLREAPGQEAPGVTMEVTEDPASGWNIYLDAEHFTFAPERAGEEARPTEGHAHLYLDGEKIARLYGAWYHLPASAVPEGEHTLMVQLNANDHTAWAVDGAAVSAETTIASTGDDGSGHQHDHSDHEDGDPPADSGDPSPSDTHEPSDETSAPPSDAAPDTDVSVQIGISGGEVSPSPGRTPVALGDTARIEVTSDQPDTIHVHGYDIEANVGPSDPAVLEFVADQPGLFEVETHDSGLLLTQLVVE